MKPAAPDNCNGVTPLRVLFALLLCGLLPLLAFATAPGWWTERGVLTNASPSDYAPANHGQLKNIARAAVAEMDAKIPGGAGDELHNLVNSWSTPSSLTNDFAPLNIAQLKSVVRPFYDRLIAAGLATSYPWLGTTSPADDFSAANIGQVKNLFSFEITAANTVDNSLGNRLAATQSFGALALETNAIWMWGDPVPDGNGLRRAIPIRESGLGGISSVSGGDHHFAVLRNDGLVLTWGGNAAGQLGDGTNSDRAVPAPVPNLANTISVKAGAAYTMALQQDGTVVAWGDNYYGNLGTGDTTSSTTPVAVVGLPPLTPVRQIATGLYRSIALMADGTVWTWGYQHYNTQNGQDVFDVVPAPVSNLTDVVDITGGYEHTVAVKSDGSVWAWGSNYSNQIANGNYWWQYQDTPFQVPNLPHITKVAAGFDHTLALAEDGTVWAWGTNNFGELGDSTTQARRAPVQVYGLTDVIAIAATWGYSLAMKSDGTVWTWGDMAVGTLAGVDKHVPQQVGLGLFDTNSNGMDDRWEIEHFGDLSQAGDGDFDGDGISNLQEYLRGTDPTDYFNGTSPILEIAGGNNQFGDAGTIAPQPLSVLVKTVSGQLARNAQVTFTVTSGDAQLLTVSGSAQQTTVYTDTNGIASVQFTFGQSNGVGSRISAVAGKLANAVTALFRAVTNYYSSSTPTPTPDPNASPTATPSPAATATPPYRYAVIDLGKEKYPGRVTNSGWVLLSGADPGNQTWGSYRWRNGTAEWLTFNAGTGAYANDISEDGVAVGSAGETNGPSMFAMVWPIGVSDGRKLNSPVISDENYWGPQNFTSASCTAVRSGTNEAYGDVLVGGKYWAVLNYGFIHGFISNSRHWSAAGVPMSLNGNDAQIVTTPTGFTSWAGQMDTIRRVNSAGTYIGTTLRSTGFMDFIGGPQSLATAEMSSMINGQPISWQSIDINEGGMIVGSHPSGIIIHTSGGSDQFIPDSINGIYPVAINDHKRPPAPSSSATPGPSATPISAPQILGWDGNATVLWERQPDGQTWQGFALEQMIPRMDGWEISDIQDMNDDGVVIGSGSFTDPAHPTSQAEGHGFMLLPVSVEKVWSDQLAGVEANYLAAAPFNGFSAIGTGNGDKNYIFMGAAQSNNFDGKGHIKAKVAVGGGDELRNKILWRLAKKNGTSYTPQTGNSTYDQSGTIVTITIDNPADGTDEADHYHLVAGYDQDGNGQLSSAEIVFVPQYDWHGAERDYEIKLVSSSHYNAERQRLLTTGWWGSFVAPQAGRLLNAFANTAVPDGATSEPTTIDRLEPGLDHPVGVLFDPQKNSHSGLPKAGAGESITAVFNPNSSMSHDVAESTTLNNWLSSRLGEHSQEVHNYFATHPDIAVYTIFFHVSTKNQQTGKDEGIPCELADYDLYLALNRVSIEADAEVEVNRSLQVNSLKLTGAVSDLYDFNYDGGLKAFVKPAAAVQAGYNTLGEGGRVYKSRIDFQNTSVPILYQFP